MNSFLTFWLFIFWLVILLFLINPTYFITLIFFSELAWTILYLIVITISSYIDESSLLSLSFFLFALAGLEFSLGFMLIILFKSLNIQLTFTPSFNNVLIGDSIKNGSIYLSKKL